MTESDPAVLSAEAAGRSKVEEEDEITDENVGSKHVGGG